ncbi:hypothetical protein ZIOFF_010188 [Zingiber officinale]|uniref:Transmembrane protein n=1 Tax=Zingiber officinale TaxID=94328 RepID=A0A8J5LP74_ZINOF|nr:hypothetical protein ZIOFF_010188 [Zingiber officinale]
MMLSGAVHIHSLFRGSFRPRSRAFPVLRWLSLVFGVLIVLVTSCVSAYNSCADDSVRGACVGAASFGFPATLVGLGPPEDDSCQDPDYGAQVGATISKWRPGGLATFRSSNGRVVSCSLVDSMSGVDDWLSAGGKSSDTVDSRSCMAPLLADVWMSTSSGNTSELHDHSKRVDSGLHDGSSMDVEIIPHSLDWGERALYTPSIVSLTVKNPHKNRVLHVFESYSSNPQYFSHGFQELIVAPGGSTSIAFVFLPKWLGSSSAHLVLQTSSGGFIIKARGIAVESPYKIEPLVGISAPNNRKLVWDFSLHNPFNDVLYVEEVSTWLSLPSQTNQSLHFICRMDESQQLSSGLDYLLADKEWFRLESNTSEMRWLDIRPNKQWEVAPNKAESVLLMQLWPYNEGKVLGGTCLKLRNSRLDKTAIVVLPLEIEIHGKTNYSDGSGLITLDIEAFEPLDVMKAVVIISLTNHGADLLRLVSIELTDGLDLFTVRYKEGFLLFPGAVAKIGSVSYSRTFLSMEIEPEIPSDCKLSIATNNSDSSVMEISCLDLIYASSFREQGSGIVASKASYISWSSQIEEEKHTNSRTGSLKGIANASAPAEVNHWTPLTLAYFVGDYYFTNFFIYHQAFLSSRSSSSHIFSSPTALLHSRDLCIQPDTFGGLSTQCTSSFLYPASPLRGDLNGHVIVKNEEYERSKLLKTFEVDELILSNWISHGAGTDTSVLEERKMFFPVVLVGTHFFKWISVHNPSQQPVVMQLILNSAEVIDHCKTDEPYEYTFSSRFTEINFPKSRIGFSLSDSAVTEALLHPSQTVMFGPIIFRPANRCMWRSSGLIRNNLSGVEWFPIQAFGGSYSLTLLEDGEPVWKLEFDNHLPLNMSSANFITSLKNTSSLCSYRISKEIYVKNIGDLLLQVKKLSISGTECSLDGFTIHECEHFTLEPGESVRLVISYNADFSTHVVQRDLELALSTGIFVIPMKASLPFDMFSQCRQTLIQPLQWKLSLFIFAAVSALVILLASKKPHSFFVATEDCYENSDRTVSKAGKNCSHHNAKLSRSSSEGENSKVKFVDRYQTPQHGSLTIKVVREKGRRRKRRATGAGLAAQLEVSSSQSGNSTSSSPVSSNASTPKKAWSVSPRSDIPYTAKCTSVVYAKPRSARTPRAVKIHSGCLRIAHKRLGSARLPYQTSLNTPKLSSFTTLYNQPKSHLKLYEDCAHDLHISRPGAPLKNRDRVKSLLGIGSDDEVAEDVCFYVWSHHFEIDLAFTPSRVSSTKIISSANNMHHAFSRDNFAIFTNLSILLPNHKKVNLRFIIPTFECD